ncbi:MAG: hypothetical protein U1F29_06240 [Planctomycetota bacterium]
MAARRTTGAAAGRDSKVRSRAGGEDKAQAAAPAEGGMGFVDAVTIGTTVMMVVAIVLMDKYLGEHFNSGMFFTHS